MYYATCALADYEADAGNPRRAIEIYEQLLERVMATKPEPLSDLRDTPKLSRVYAALAGLYDRSGDREKAAVMKSRRIDLWRQWQLKLPHNAFVREQLEAARM